jgi:hypothetical protein
MMPVERCSREENRFGDRSWLLKRYLHLVIASQNRQRGPLLYEDIEPAKCLGRLFPLSIPDLIRDPVWRHHSSFKR